MTPEQARIGGLARFAIGITVFNLLGHTILGFEPSGLQLVVTVATAYLAEIALEAIGAWSERRQPLFAGGFKRFVIFLLPAHITGFATSMLVYGGDRLLPYIFAASLAIASKSIFAVKFDGRRRHFMNPSNTGIVVTIFLFPSVSMAPPYHFTENLYGYWYWVLPAIFLCFGTFLNAMFTKKLPLIVTWATAFALQAVARHYLYATSLLGSLAPMLGVTFLLFTFYMITDPQTSPSSVRGQIMFGAAVGAVYGLLIALHVVYAIVLSLFVVCVGRGLILYAGKFAANQKVRAWNSERLFTTFARSPLTNPAPKDMVERLTKP